MARLRQGDAAGFDALFRYYGPQVYRFALSYLKDGFEAEETVQNCFLKIWENRESLDAARPLKGYLFTVAHHAILNHLRRSRRLDVRNAALAAASPAAAPGPDAALEYQELETRYLAAVQRLPPKRRHIFTLNRTHGLSYAQIATELGLSVRTVEAQIAQALKSLRQELPVSGAVAMALSYWLGQ